VLTRTKQARSIAGLILAGGSSRRFGSDKALACLPGEQLTLLDRAIGVLNTISDSVSVVAPEDRPYPHLLPDRFPGKGPLGGLISGLAEIGTDCAIIIAVDQFSISVATLLRLLNAQKQSDAMVYRSLEGQIYPLPLAINRSALPGLQYEYERGTRSLAAALINIGVALLETEPNDRLMDADQPADLDPVE
jgi:molybdopterin-guanine dinucleotide biosynthesis protein A